MKALLIPALILAVNVPAAGADSISLAIVPAKNAESRMMADLIEQELDGVQLLDRGMLEAVYVVDAGGGRNGEMYVFSTVEKSPPKITARDVKAMKKMAVKSAAQIRKTMALPISSPKK